VVYLPEDGVLYDHRRENLKSYIASTGWALQQRRNVSPVRYELSSYLPKDGILHSHGCENLKYSKNTTELNYEMEGMNRTNVYAYSP
jgi:hypothetical protein